MTTKTDPAMELLCTLPRFPARASFRDLRDDLNYYSSKQLEMILKKLKPMGARWTAVTRGPGESYAWIAPQEWRAAQKIAETYWDATYSD